MTHKLARKSHTAHAEGIVNPIATPATRKRNPPHAPPAVSRVPETVSVWLDVKSLARPPRMQALLGELAEPDFYLDSCRESARVAPERSDCYEAHWYCRFTRGASDDFADLRLLKRLTGAGFHVLRFESSQRAA